MSDTPHLAMMSLREVAATLGVKDTDTAARWLEKHGIAVHLICRVRKVFAVEVAIAIDMMFVQKLRRNYPDWKARYQILAKDQAVCRLVIAEMEARAYPSKKKVLPLSELDKKLIKKLNQ